MSHRDMSEMTRIQYLRSEIVMSPIIYDAATSIFSSMVANKSVTPENENEMMERAVKMALELALTTDRIMALPQHSSRID